MVAPFCITKLGRLRTQMLLGLESLDPQEWILFALLDCDVWSYAQLLCL